MYLYIYIYIYIYIHIYVLYIFIFLTILDVMAVYKLLSPLYLRNGRHLGNGIKIFLSDTK